MSFRLSSAIRTIEDGVLGAAGKMQQASRQLYDELYLEARARTMVKIELRATRQAMIESFKESIAECDRIYAQQAKRKAAAAKRKAKQS